MGAKKDHALDNLRCEARTSTKALSRGSAPELKGRRSFIRHMTSFGTALAGSVILRATAESRSGPESPSTTRPATGSCARSAVTASDASTVAETTTGKIRGFRRNGVYTFRGLPYGASTAGERRFMPPIKPEPWTGIRNALQYGRICPYQDSAHFDLLVAARYIGEASVLPRGI